MIQIYEVAPNKVIRFPRYFFYDFIAGSWSSDFDSLEQLIDIGFSDTEIAHYSNELFLTSIEKYSDCTLLIEVENLEDIYNYPELFI